MNEKTKDISDKLKEKCAKPAQSGWISMKIVLYSNANKTSVRDLRSFGTGSLLHQFVLTNTRGYIGGIED